jgi:hypothetical protein
MNLLLGIMPFLQTMNEISGSYEPQIDDFILRLQNEIQNCLDKIEEELSSDENVQKFILEEACILIPDEIKDIIRHIFTRLFEFMIRVTEQKKEIEFSKDILKIFMDLDYCRSILERFNSLIFTEEKIMDNLYQCFITLTNDIEELENKLN